WRGDVRREAHVGKGPPDPLLHRLAELVHSRLVYIPETPARIEARDEIRRMLRQRAELLAEGAERGRPGALMLQLVAGTPLLGGIAQDHHPRQSRGRRSR